MGHQCNKSKLSAGMLQLSVPFSDVPRGLHLFTHLRTYLETQPSPCHFANAQRKEDFSLWGIFPVPSGADMLLNVHPQGYFGAKQANSRTQIIDLFPALPLTKIPVGKLKLSPTFYSTGARLEENGLPSAIHTSRHGICFLGLLCAVYRCNGRTATGRTAVLPTRRRVATRRPPVAAG